jgi:hypothetical protein
VCKQQFVQHIQFRDKPQTINLAMFKQTEHTAVTIISGKLFPPTHARTHAHTKSAIIAKIWAVRTHRPNEARLRQHGTPFFRKSAITSAVYLGILDNFVFPQIVAGVHGYISHKDVSPVHFYTTLNNFLADGSAGRGWLIRHQGIHT